MDESAHMNFGLHSFFLPERLKWKVNIEVPVHINYAWSFFFKSLVKYAVSSIHIPVINFISFQRIYNIARSLAICEVLDRVTDWQTKP